VVTKDAKESWFFAGSAIVCAAIDIAEPKTDASSLIARMISFVAVRWCSFLLFTSAFYGMLVLQVDVLPFWYPSFPLLLDSPSF
jgi:hypothetical protein